MTNEAGPDHIIVKNKPKAESETPSTTNTHVEAALGSLGNVEHAIDNPEKPPEVPSIAEQLSRILEMGETAYAMGSFYANMDEHQMEELWNAYIQTIDDFRLAYANLPPLKEIDTEYKTHIFKAMRNKDAATLIEIFDTESKEYNEPAWKKIPGVKFGKGFFTAGKQVVEGGAILAESFAKAPGIGVTEDEKEHARAVLNTVGNSLLNFTQVVQNYFRIPEYEEALAQNRFKQKYFDEEMAGRYGFDVATFFMGNIVKIATGGAQAAKVAGGITKVSGGAAKIASAAATAGRVVLTEIAPDVVEYASKAADRKETGL